MKEDLELKQFRDLMKPPDKWEEGFGLRAMIGGLFVGIIMTPASMYMQLVTGQDIGGAAQWVTIILFIEVARRSFTTLRRPEIYVLYYMAGATLISSGPGAGLLWNQFMVQSDSFRQFGLADRIPEWVAPRSQDILGTRSFFHSAWLAPIGLMVLGQLLYRVDSFCLGYVMYRLTSDVEKLPFPLAPVGAQGITALADASSGEESWRWRVFSFGSMLGLAFGAIYFALPAITGAFLPEPIKIFPIPFFDMTNNTEDLLPAVPVIISFNLGVLLVGMILPFWAMVGSFIGLVFTVAFNPVLYRAGMLPNWSDGIGAIRTIQSNTLDFYFSFGLGLTFAIAVIGFWHVFGGMLKARKDPNSQVDWKALANPPVGRGDFSLYLAILLYLAAMALTICVALLLLHHAALIGAGSPLTVALVGVFIFYGFIYTPLISYVSARMEGIVGMTVQIPFVREATFILTGYQGAAVWFAPFPAHNYGAQTLFFRKTELTGTSFRSMIKAELFVFPVTIVATVLFSQFIWQIAPVPSATFPYAEKFWELVAYRQALIYSSTMPGGEGGAFAQAFNWFYLLGGLGIALLVYAVLSFFGLPVLLVYGVIRGLDQSTPDVILPQFAGALLGRYYFAKIFGNRWPDYRVVFFAGYSCGFGLVTMLSLGLVFISKSVFQAQY